jgi:16S rRNA (cytosine967-C5)-methyltransferase
MPVTGISTQSISPARRSGFGVLVACEEGGYASDLLRGETKHLDPRDASLASQIVYGCLRFQAQLDYLIQLFSGREPHTLDLPVILSLRMAIFQLRYLERVPPHAAVHEAVELVKRHKRSAAGFTNAVLRKVHRRPVQWPSLDVEVSCPAWLLESWTRHFGATAPRAIANQALHEPSPYIRVQPGSPIPEGIEVEPTGVPGCFRLLSAAPPGMRLHDISSQAIVPLLEPVPGHSYLDLCAAPGNKTLQALETRLRLAIACDISARRIKDIPAICPRVVLDATQPLPYKMNFDRIFIDAPCSGTGTLARNPEIKWRLQPGGLKHFQERQIAIVLQGLKHLAPHGKLLYSTCSLEDEENEQVIQTVLAANPQVRQELAIWRIPGRDPGDGFYAAVLSYKA